MPVIALFSGSFCHGDPIATRLGDTLGYTRRTDDDLIAAAHQRFKVGEERLRRAIHHPTSVFNKFTHDREKAVAMLKAVVAGFLEQEGLLLQGHACHLIPPSIAHVLKVCVIAEGRYRAARAAARSGTPEAQALKQIKKEDDRQQDWAEFVLHNAPWNPSLYDIVVPVDQLGEDGAVELILDNSSKKVLQPTPDSIRAVHDFELAAQVEVALAMEGYHVDIAAHDGSVTLTINQHVLMLTRFEEELRQVVQAVPGVREIATRIGPNFYQTDIYRRQNFEAPSKVLLVDDEREFAQTLSERLSMRDVGTAIAYNGEEALSVLDDDEPEVMVLDLKMPGIDGIEVLRRVKRDHANVEVIILTGHGSAEDEKICRELGACAYLKKPVNIDELSRAMQEAYQRLQRTREEKP